MARTKSTSEAKKNSKELAAAIRAGCFSSEREAVREAVQMMFASRPQLRLEAAIQQYLEGEITLGRAADSAGVTRWRFRELLLQRGIRLEVEARPAKELEEAVRRIRNRRR
jgi:predicted HTH domain antitoxin